MSIVGGVGWSDQEKESFYTIGDLILLCKKYPEHIFRFNESEYYPEDLMSWRGSYELPAINYGNHPTKGKDLSERLERQLEQHHSGYKGGEYFYFDFDEFYVSAYGSSEEHKVTGYQVTDKEILLITEFDKY